MQSFLCDSINYLYNESPSKARVRLVIKIHLWRAVAMNRPDDDAYAHDCLQLQSFVHFGRRPSSL